MFVLTSLLRNKIVQRVAASQVVSAFLNKIYTLSFVAHSAERRHMSCLQLPRRGSTPPPPEHCRLCRYAFSQSFTMSEEISDRIDCSSRNGVIQLLGPSTGDGMVILELLASAFSGIVGGEP